MRFFLFFLVPSTGFFETPWGVMLPRVYFFRASTSREQEWNVFELQQKVCLTTSMRGVCESFDKDNSRGIHFGGERRNFLSTWDLKL